MSSNQFRLAIFIEGAFFVKINTYYRYHHRVKSNMTFNGLFDFLCEEVAFLEEVPSKFCKMVESHWYRGRFSTQQLEKKVTDPAQRFKQMVNERKLDDLFMYQGITQHHYPVQYNPKTGQMGDAIVSMYLTVDALSMAALDKFDGVVLLAGDSSYLPLLKKINSLGKKVIVPVWNFEFENETDSGIIRNVTRTSQALIDECTYPIAMSDFVDLDTEDNEKFRKMIFRV